MKRSITLALSIGISLFTSNSIFAATTANVAVSATVVKNCSITVPTGLAFGNYDPISDPVGTNLTATGTVSVACTKSTPVTNLYIGMGPGQGTSCPTTTPVTTRCMKDSSSNLLSYEIYQPPDETPGQHVVRLVMFGAIHWQPVLF